MSTATSFGSLMQRWKHWLLFGERGMSRKSWMEQLGTSFSRHIEKPSTVGYN